MKKILGSLMMLMLFLSCTSSETIGTIDVTRRGPYHDLILDTQEGDVLTVMFMQNSSVALNTFRDMKKYYAKESTVLLEQDNFAVYKRDDTYIYIYWKYSKFFTYETGEKIITDYKYNQLLTALNTKKVKTGIDFLQLVKQYGLTSNE